MSSIEYIPLSKLRISDKNVRKDVGDVTDLAKSIAEKGILQPPIVRTEDSKFGVVMGSRRFAAAKQAKLDRIPCMIRDMGDEEAIEISLVENLQRQDIEPKEAGEGVAELIGHFNLTQAHVAKKLGHDQAWVSQVLGVHELIKKIERFKIEVKNRPEEDERQQGRAIPYFHAFLLSSATNAPSVRSYLHRMEPERSDEIVAEIAKAISPLTQTQADRGLDFFRDHPRASPEQIADRGIWGDTTGRLGGGSSGPADETAEEDRQSLQMHNKLIWNLQRIEAEFDYYTVGYGYTTPDNLIKRLKAKKIKTLVDVRNNASGSFYRSEYNRDELEPVIKSVGIRYMHMPELGVPRDQRDDLTGPEEYKALWKWYDKNVIPKAAEIIKSIEKVTHGPLAFMCRELDPTKCHRHRIAKALESDGKTTLDL